MKQEQPIILHRGFADFDELCEAASGWNLELCKLDTTRFHGETFQYIEADFVFSRANFSCRLQQTGAPPAGLRTFAFSAVPKQELVWRGRHVTAEDLLVFPRGGELHAINGANWDMLTLAVDEALLLHTAERLGFQGLEKTIDQHEVLRVNSLQMNRLRASLLQVCSERSANKPEILTHLLNAIASAVPETQLHDPTRLRLKAIQKAENYIFAHAEEPPTVMDICRETGVSKRTLEYSFSDYFGMNPKAYINAIRLNSVHKQLRVAEPESMHVADAANRLGFWHMGQFAADYRKIFGENPSITLGCIAVYPDPADCPASGLGDASDTPLCFACEGKRVR